MTSLEYVIDDIDLAHILQYIRNVSGSIYTQKGTKIRTDTQPKQGQIWALFPIEVPLSELLFDKNRNLVQDTDCIWLQFPTYSPFAEFMPGSFCCNNQGGDAIKLFRTIKKHIQATFHINYDKIYYLGPSLYERWLKDQVSLHFPVDIRCFKVKLSNEELYAFFGYMKLHGYLIQENGYYLGSIQSEDRIRSGYLIHGSSARTPYRIVNYCKMYFLNAEGVFLTEYTRKKYNFKIYADERNFKAGSSVPTLFSIIYQYFINTGSIVESEKQ